MSVKTNPIQLHLFFITICILSGFIHLFITIYYFLFYWNDKFQITVHGLIDTSPNILLYDPHNTHLLVRGKNIYLAIAKLLKWRLVWYFDDINISLDIV